jgi:hypothetical protein
VPIGGLAVAGRADDEQHLTEVRDQANLIHRRHPGVASGKQFGQTGGNGCLMIARLIFHCAGVQVSSGS